MQIEPLEAKFERYPMPVLPSRPAVVYTKGHCTECDHRVNALNSETMVCDFCASGIKRKEDIPKAAPVSHAASLERRGYHYLHGLRQTRLKRGLTPVQLADKADLDPSQVYAYERLAKRAGPEKQKQLARALKVAVSSILRPRKD